MLFFESLKARVACLAEEEEQFFSTLPAPNSLTSPVSAPEVEEEGNGSAFQAFVACD
jgi:hypothetical protein